VPDTRTALLDAATRLLDEGGVDAVTLREVGRLAGVSHNAPYKHFASKEALLAAVAAGFLAERRDGVPARSAAPAEALRATLIAYVGWAVRHPVRFKLVFGRWTIDSPELAEAAHAAHEALVSLVTDAQATGALPAGDPVRMASLLRALTHGAADLALAGHLAADGKGHADPEDLVDDLLSYLALRARA
jgi:AcrR family transcriptional regulator